MTQEAIYPFRFENAGLKKLEYENLTESQKEKYNFVKDHVSPMIKAANCGWYGCEYVVYENGTETVFFLNKYEAIDRGVNVTWDSKLGILHDIFDNIE